MSQAHPDFLTDAELPAPTVEYPTRRREQFLEKPLPSSEDAERAILGGILVDNGLIAEPAESLAPDDFYSPLNRRIFAAMLVLFAESKPIDPILIGEELKKHGPIDAIGGISTITNLSYGLPYFTDLGQYIEIVQKKKSLRDLIRAANAIQADALEESEDATLILDRAEQAIFNLANQPTKHKPEQINVLAHASVTKATDLMENPRTVTGVPTGLIDLDDLTGGLHKPDLIILAARPSMGKTALALQMAKVGCDDLERVGLFFSLEMSKEQLINRLICSEARVNLFSYQHGRLMPKHMQDTVASMRNTIPGRKLFIDDTPGISPMQMFATARRIYAEHKRLDFITVDYLQLMSSSGGRSRGDNRVQEVSQISRELKAIAKELNVPVLALSQLSRAPEGRNPPKPMLSDLRESGSIEQDADVVMFVYREEYYKETEENKGMADLLISKHRNGPTGEVKVTFIKEYARFETLANW